MRVLAFGLVFCLWLHTGARSEPVQIQQGFSEDPGWIGFQNRMVCVDCPTVEQNFGWNPAAHIHFTDRLPGR